MITPDDNNNAAATIPEDRAVEQPRLAATTTTSVNMPQQPPELVEDLDSIESGNKKKSVHFATSSSSSAEATVTIVPAIPEEYYPDYYWSEEERQMCWKEAIQLARSAKETYPQHIELIERALSTRPCEQQQSTTGSALQTQGTQKLLQEWSESKFRGLEPWCTTGTQQQQQQQRQHLHLASQINQCILKYDSFLRKKQKENRHELLRTRSEALTQRAKELALQKGYCDAKNCRKSNSNGNYQENHYQSSYTKDDQLHEQEQEQHDHDQDPDHDQEQPTTTSSPTNAKRRKSRLSLRKCIGHWKHK